MIWNWQQKDWPEFKYERHALDGFEANFLQGAGYLKGAMSHLTEDEKSSLTVDALSDEALKTSEIEGEYLNRDSLQSSIRRNIGLHADNRKVRPEEQGISDMMTDLYQNFGKPLSKQILFDWHSMVMNGSHDIDAIGGYRTHKEPMQVISGAMYKQKVHFEAPPSVTVPAEMKNFINWFNKTAPDGQEPLPALLRAAIVHIYFESIHPFEDGNGRLGRALVIKSLCQNLDEPMLLALSHIIQKYRKHYYNALEKNNKSTEVTSWLIFFAQVILEAQSYTKYLVGYVIEKGKMYSRVKEILNDREKKVLDRIFRDGPDSFPLGMSADKYIAITNTSRATATRDLQDMVGKGIFIREGQLKSSRYFLNLPIGRFNDLQFIEVS